MKGNLPPPVEKMLEQKHGIFDRIECDIKLKDGISSSFKLGESLIIDY